MWQLTFESIEDLYAACDSTKVGAPWRISAGATPMVVFYELRGCGKVSAWHSTTEIGHVARHRYLPSSPSEHLT
jgi:hypothetical protein